MTRGSAAAARLLRRLEGWFGRRGLRTIVGAPLIAALLVAIAMPALTHTNVKATGLIDIYPVVGTHSAYDVVGYVVDFSAKFKSADAARSAASRAGISSDAAAALLIARRVDDSSRVRVEFAAPSAAEAEAGLREAARVALRQTAEGIVESTRAEYAVVRSSFVQLMTDVEGWWAPPVGPNVVPGTIVEARRIAAVQRAGLYMESARSALTDAELSVGAVNRAVDAAAVSTSFISTRLEKSRVVVTAALSTLIGTTIIVLGLRRSTARFRWARFLD